MDGISQGNELKTQRTLALLLIIFRLPEFFTSLVASIASGSAVVWLEFIENASILIPGMLLAILSQKLDRNLKYVFNYGTGKVEAITALSCELFDIAGLFCVFFFAVSSLFSPAEKQDYIVLALVVSIIGFFIDLFILRKQKEIAENYNSKMFHTAYVSAKKEFFFDVASIVTLTITIIFKESEWIKYFSSVISILISIPFYFIVTKHIKHSLTELIDRTLDEESQLKIIKALNEFYESYDQLGEVRSRINGDERFVDIELKFAENMIYSDIEKTAVAIRKRVEEELGPSTVNILIL